MISWKDVRDWTMSFEGWGIDGKKGPSMKYVGEGRGNRQKEQKMLNDNMKREDRTKWGMTNCGRFERLGERAISVFKIKK